MEENQLTTVLIRDIPKDVIEWLESRAARNYRSRSGEIMAILTAIARSDATLPGLGVGEMIPAARIVDEMQQTEINVIKRNGGEE